MSTAWEDKRMELIATTNHLETAADLDAFLVADIKTKDDPALQRYWRAKLQAAVPKLRA